MHSPELEFDLKSKEILLLYNTVEGAQQPVFLQFYSYWFRARFNSVLYMVVVTNCAGRSPFVLNDNGKLIDQASSRPAQNSKCPFLFRADPSF